VYSPQMLIAVLAINAATKRAAATAVGLTGILGYLSKIASGYGVGYVVHNWGWDHAFQGCILSCLITIVLFAFTWNLTPHPSETRRA
jgi:sugar phosphate permease